MNYYLYQHVRLDTNEIFYIGKGTKYKKGNVYRRAYTKSSRNTYWKNIVKSIPYKVEILGEYSSEEECLKKETELIRLYGYSWNGTGTLCNMIDDQDAVRRLARIKLLQKTFKEVHQYDLEGNYLRSFPSVIKAKKEFGGDIYNAVAGIHATAGNFQWRDKKYDKIPPYFSKLLDIENSKTIYQYDEYNNLIKEWKGSKLPSEELKINRTAIRNCLCGLAKTAGGFKWSYEKLEKDEDLKNYSVYKDGILVFTSDILRKCAEKFGFNPISVSVYLRRKKPYKGYLFICHNIKTQSERNEK